jgi:hypothetical protein
MRNKSELRDYQQRIIGELYENDERIVVARPGAGKSTVGLTAFQELKRDGHVRHALVLAPKRVARMVWPDEIRQWAHLAGLTCQVLSGTPRQRADMLADSPNYDLTIVGLDVLPWLVDELAPYPDDHPLFDLLIIDEISRLRNPTGVRVKKLLRRAGRWKMRWGMSGTLRPSGVEDLFMPATVITNKRLWGGSFYKWRAERFYPTDYQGYNWAPMPAAEETINREIAPICSTLRDDELPQLPPLSILIDRVELPPLARKLYQDMFDKLFAHVDDTTVLAASAAVATGKLAQMANGFVYDNDGVTGRVHDEKRDWVQDIVDNAVGPTLLVYEYREDLEMLRGILGEDLPYLGGGATNAESDHNITQWNAGALPFMALHPASGGHGLNLQPGGSDMAWISPTWSPELWEQTIARLYRSGQTKPVIVRVCAATGTVDQMKLDRVYGKISAQEAFERYLRAAGKLSGGPVGVEKA